MHRDANAETNSQGFWYTSQSPADTVSLGTRIGSLLFPGSVVGLIGELGAGKTCFVKGLAGGINQTPESDVTSPTFTILHEYSGELTLYHFDAYRISGQAELEPIGFDECLNAGGIVVVEWADRVLDAFPDQRLIIQFDIVDEHKRSISCVAHGIDYCAIIQKLRTFEDAPQ